MGLRALDVAEVGGVEHGGGGRRRGHAEEIGHGNSPDGDGGQGDDAVGGAGRRGAASVRWLSVPMGNGPTGPVGGPAQDETGLRRRRAAGERAQALHGEG